MRWLTSLDQKWVVYIREIRIINIKYTFRKATLEMERFFVHIDQSIPRHNFTRAMFQSVLCLYAPWDPEGEGEECVRREFMRLPQMLAMLDEQVSATLTL